MAIGTADKTQWQNEAERYLRFNLHDPDPHAPDRRARRPGLRPRDRGARPDRYRQGLPAARRPSASAAHCRD